MKILWIVLIAILVAGCGPSAGQMTATAVMAQAQTQTAAPTFTPTATATLMPTVTPTSTSTLTPTSTPEAAIIISHEAPGAPPAGQPNGTRSKLFTTTGGSFLINIPADSGDPWNASYFLTLKITGSLPANAVLEAHFENPLDPATAIVVSLENIPSGKVSLTSPPLTGLKCRNYWVEVHAYADASKADELGVHLQWIKSSFDLDKVTSVADLTSDKTCH